MPKQSLIFDIKRFSINDGPGIRVTVFFKGCPLSCAWCHNPESQSSEVQKFYSAAKCIGCGTCVESCPENALVLNKENGVITDFDKCILCGTCAIVCPSKAMEMSGRHETAESIMEAIRRESLIMDTSGGGVTFSGGEPLQHPELLLPLLRECGQEGIHRAVDTCGLASAELLMKVAEHTDLFLYDLKHMDPDKHKEYTGVSNEKILENLVLLSEAGCHINIRIPLIEGFNADEDNIKTSAAFISSLPGRPKLLSLLPYHNIASVKYKKLGTIYEPGAMKEPSNEKIAECLAIFNKFDITAVVGG